MMETLAAIVVGGVVSNVVVVNPQDQATIDALGCVILPEGSPVTAGWSYDGAEFISPPRYQTLEQAKVERKELIERWRNAAEYANVVALGRPFQADKMSRDLLAQAITLSMAGEPLPPVWRGANNSDQQITDISQLVAIAGAMRLSTQAAYMRSWELKAAVDAAQTVADVEAVVW